MPDRIIKESICTSDTLNELTDFEERFWHRLIVNCDDYGRFDARPAILRGRLFPLQNRTDKNMSDALYKLASVGLVDLYQEDGKPFLQVVTWEKYQRIRAKRSKFPGPSAGTRGHLPSSADRCPRNPIQSESESESECENTRTRENGGGLPRSAFGEFENVWLHEGELSGLYNGEHDKATIDAAIEWYSGYKKANPAKPFPKDADYANIKRYAISAVLERRGKAQGRAGLSPPPTDEQKRKQEETAKRDMEDLRRLLGKESDA